MKILTSTQIKQADAFTIINEPISSEDLMERAATKCYDWFIEKYDVSKPVTIFCGVGNNGGDGLVLARKLQEKGYEITVYEVAFSKKYSDDFLANKAKIDTKKIDYSSITLVKEIPIINEESIIVDAIFGIGLSRAVNRFLSRLFYVINQSGAEVVSIDIPSGLFAESNDKNNLKNVVFADFTLTFEAPKLSYFFPETNHFFGELVILKINLHPQFIEKVKSNYTYFTKQNAQEIYQKRRRFVHKGNMGRALLVAGSFGKMGACVLAAKACKKVGVGLLTVHVPALGYTILQTVLPEAMVLSDKNNEHFTEGLNTKKYTVVGVGPGLGIKKATRKALSFLISQTDCPMVVDADALNILSNEKQLFLALPKNSVITPHRGEWERITGIESSDSLAQLKAARKFAVEYEVIIVLKDAITAIIDTKGQVYFNASGNSALATGGSGDVLTGMITGLIAQGYDSLAAAKLAVYLHGKAADIGVEAGESAESFIASDIFRFLGRAFKVLG